MARKVITAFSFLLFTAFLSSCVTRGQDFSSDLSWIKKNQTTQTDVSSILGEPYQIGDSGGTPTWTYGFYHFRLFGDSATKELKFYWNSDKTVQSYSFSSSFPADRRKAMFAPKS